MNLIRIIMMFFLLGLFFAAFVLFIIAVICSEQQKKRRKRMQENFACDFESTETKEVESAPDPTPHPDEKKPFSEILKEYRQSRRFSQEYVAEALNVSRQAVSKWETGTSEPSTANLLALARLYGVSVDELLKNITVE